MTLNELCKAVNAAISVRPDGLRCRQLTRNALEIAALTGWAPGVIDPQGRFDQLCTELQGRIKRLHETSGGNELAELHDALAELREAVARHDDDLAPSRDDGDDGDALY